MLPPKVIPGTTPSPAASRIIGIGATAPTAPATADANTLANLADPSNAPTADPTPPPETLPAASDGSVTFEIFGGGRGAVYKDGTPATVVEIEGRVFAIAQTPEQIDELRNAGHYFVEVK